MAAGAQPNLAKALAAGVVANFGIGVAKGVAWFFTGSAAMLAESLHSIADSSNQLLLALGLRRSKRDATEVHPFGYGAERYFWSFLVALLIFLLGGAFAIYEGIHKLIHPEPMRSGLAWIYGALSVGFVFEAYALRVAWTEFQHLKARHPGLKLFDILRATKDPTLPTVLFEDAAALAGLTLAAIGVTLAWWTGESYWDACASITIGVVLVGVSWFLAIESHSLLIGEGAGASDRAAIVEAAKGDADVVAILELLTLHRAPEDLMVALTVDFRDGLDTAGVENAVKRIEARIREAVPAARRIFVEAGVRPSAPPA